MVLNKEMHTVVTIHQVGEGNNCMMGVFILLIVYRSTSQRCKDAASLFIEGGSNVLSLSLFARLVQLAIIYGL